MSRPETIAKYVGKRFGRLTVLEFSHQDPVNNMHAFYLCRCDCGTEKLIRIGALQGQGKTKSCGCYGAEQRLKGCLGNTYRRRAFGENARNGLYLKYQRMARKRDLSFDLTIDDFAALTSADCYYCSAPPSSVCSYANAYGGYTYNGVDRVDNAIGYTPTNCVPCCGACNAIKNGITREMVMKIHAFLTTPALPTWRERQAVGAEGPKSQPIHCEPTS